MRSGLRCPFSITSSTKSINPTTAKRRGWSFRATRLGDLMAAICTSSSCGRSLWLTSDVNGAPQQHQSFPGGQYSLPHYGKKKKKENGFRNTIKSVNLNLWFPRSQSASVSGGWAGCLEAPAHIPQDPKDSPANNRRLDDTGHPHNPTAVSWQAWGGAPTWLEADGFKLELINGHLPPLETTTN